MSDPAIRNIKSEQEVSSPVFVNYLACPPNIKSEASIMIEHTPPNETPEKVALITVGAYDFNSIEDYKNYLDTQYDNGGTSSSLSRFWKNAETIKNDIEGILGSMYVIQKEKGCIQVGGLDLFEIYTANTDNSNKFCPKTSTITIESYLNVQRGRLSLTAIYNLQSYIQGVPPSGYSDIITDMLWGKYDNSSTPPINATPSRNKLYSLILTLGKMLGYQEGRRNPLTGAGRGSIHSTATTMALSISKDTTSRAFKEALQNVAGQKNDVIQHKGSSLVSEQNLLIIIAVMLKILEYSAENDLTEFKLKSIANTAKELACNLTTDEIQRAAGSAFVIATAKKTKAT